jgi:hypothetical protein
MLHRVMVEAKAMQSRAFAERVAWRARMHAKKAADDGEADPSSAPGNVD